MIRVILILLSLVGLIKGNIWDNIFGNLEAPQISYPNEFNVKFDYIDESSGQSLMALDINFSLPLRSLKVSPQRQILGADITLGNLLYTSEMKSIYVNTLVQKCQIIKTPNILSNDKYQFKSEVDITIIWRFIALYEGKQNLNGSSYEVFDISTLLTLFDNYQYLEGKAYFDSHNKLKLIKITESETRKTHWLRVLKDINEINFTPNDFLVPKIWDCEHKNTTLDYSNHTLSQLADEFKTQAAKYNK